MSAVLEIQAAIEKLPPAEFNKLRAWIEEYVASVRASDILFTMYDREERLHVN